MIKKSKPGYYSTHPQKSTELFLLRTAQGENSLQARAAKNQIILNNERFLRATISQWIGPNSSVDFDFVLQEARISFLHAIEKYDLNRDVSIRTYAKFHLMELRRSIFKASKFIELKDEHCIEKCFLDNPDFKDFDLNKTIRPIIERELTALERDVIIMLYFDGLKKRQIAILRQCSEARICNIVKSALPKLKHYLSSIGIVPGFLELN